MRKVGVDGGAANGGGGGTKRSAPGHGPAKNRLTIVSFLSGNRLNLKINPIMVQSLGHFKVVSDIPILAGCSLGRQPVRRRGVRRALMASTTIFRTKTSAHFLCTLAPSLRSGSIGSFLIQNLT